MIRLALCLCLLASIALAADVDPSLCRDIDDTTRPIVPTLLLPWCKFEHAVQACPAYGKQHEFLWWIMTINVEFEPVGSYQDPALHPLDPGGFTRRQTPRPFIVDRAGRELGRLSDWFPGCGATCRTDLIFSEWVNGFPNRVTIKVFNAWVHGDYTAPPLKWNAGTRHYDQVGRGNFDDAP